MTSFYQETIKNIVEDPFKDSQMITALFRINRRLNTILPLSLASHVAFLMPLPASVVDMSAQFKKNCAGAMAQSLATRENKPAELFGWSRFDSGGFDANMPCKSAKYVDRLMRRGKASESEDAEDQYQEMIALFRIIKGTMCSACSSACLIYASAQTKIYSKNFTPEIC